MNNTHVIKRNLFKVLFIAMIMISSFDNAAYADVSNGLMVSRISVGQPTVYAKKSFAVQAEVMEVKAKQKDGGDLDQASFFAEAKVTAYLTKDGREHKIMLQHEGNGKYKGFIILPDAGKWKTIVFADYQEGHNEDLNQIHFPAQNVLDMVIDVQPTSKTSNWIEFITVIAVIFLGFIFWQYKKHKLK
ncbi:hypothetical protein [Paenibacillus agricola]|uniref:YtkA-like domain-containing protein n=1 Tax=Paenibacillus agricola TaxID=2716264 RepID=A0ABX0JEH3_9BACL|nr:hypothetical protein [Paenibacillus agricola]NHN33282.1 hypothetical protein [Paenibacillus agricola]